MKQQSAAEFFDRYAHDFAAIYGNDNRASARLINALFRRSMRERYRRTLAACSPLEGRTVLDIGCGPGHYAVALAERGAARVVGIDIAPAMIELAAQRADTAGVADRCEFVTAGFMAHTFQDPFDYAILMGFMDYVADPVPVIRKAVLLTGRKAMFSFPVSRGLLAWQRRLRYRSRTPLYLYDRGQIEQSFAAAGVDRVTVDAIGRDFFVTVDTANAGAKI